MFIVSITFTSPITEVEKHLSAHLEYVKVQHENNNFIAAGPKTPLTGVIILSKLKIKEELESIMFKDPYYIAGLADYQITEFIPSMTAVGFENLKEI
ncbi:MAG: YciI family protein [bacterium]